MVTLVLKKSNLAFMYLFKMIGADHSDSEMRKLALASMKEIEIKNTSKKILSLSNNKLESHQIRKISKGNISAIT